MVTAELNAIRKLLDLFEDQEDPQRIKDMLNEWKSRLSRLAVANVRPDKKTKSREEKLFENLMEAVKRYEESPTSENLEKLKYACDCFVAVYSPKVSWRFYIESYLLAKDTDVLDLEDFLNWMVNRGYVHPLQARIGMPALYQALHRRGFRRIGPKLYKLEKGGDHGHDTGQTEKNSQRTRGANQ